jgi:hypothetical protein
LGAHGWNIHRGMVGRNRYLTFLLIIF